ncbi:MAG: DUF5673 domain-containing protein [Halosimplex sp.]
MRQALRLVITTYVALLVAPVATLAPAPTWPAFAAGAVLGGAVGYAATATVDYRRGLQSLPVVLGGFVLPLGWLWPAFSGADSAAAFFVSPWFVGALAVVPWFVGVVAAYERRTRDRIDALTERVVFEARNPPRTRRQTKIAAGVVMVTGGAAVVVSVALGSGDSDFVYWWFPAMLPVWLPILADSDGKEVAVADEGLRVERQVHDWATVDGYELTDDALTLRRPRWYHSDLSFDRGDVENLDEVTAALDERLACV